MKSTGKMRVALFALCALLAATLAGLPGAKAGRTERCNALKKDCNKWCKTDSRCESCVCSRICVGKTRLKTFKNKTTVASACGYKCGSWKVDIEFIIGSKECASWNSTKCKRIRTWLADEIKDAERLYSSAPAMKIAPTFKYLAEKGGRSLSEMVFKNGLSFTSYMDKYMDHVVQCKKRFKSGKLKGRCYSWYWTRGNLRYLVVDSLSVGGKAIGGRAHFPFTRKFGPALVVPYSIKSGYYQSKCAVKTTGVFAHEMGHTFGFIHTFSPSICNKEYAKKEGSSKKPDGSMNLMDYGRKNGNCPAFLYLNKCQKDRAARWRKRYDTKCKVNYQFMKGIL